MPSSRSAAASPSAAGATAATRTPSAARAVASRSRNPPVGSPAQRGKAWARKTTLSGSGTVGAVGMLHQGVDQGGPEPGRELVAEAGDAQQAGPGDGGGGGLAAADPDDLVLLAVHDQGRHPDRAQGGGPVAGGQDGRELPPGPLGVVGAVVAAGGA